jgi:hypothetical protein
MRSENDSSDGKWNYEYDLDNERFVDIVGRMIVMSIDYGWEKFFNALSYAIGSAASPQERLEGVIGGTSHLERDSFPDDETWVAFSEMLTVSTSRAAEGDEGKIRATTSRMTDDEAAKWLTKSFEIFSEIAEAYGAQEH